MPKSPPSAGLALRFARSVSFAAVCVVLAALGHQAAGGDGPTVGALAVAMLGAFGAAFALAGRERSPGVIAGVQVAAQVVLHELFTEGQTARVLIGPLTDPGHDHGGFGVSVGMVLAHLTASLVTAWWLARGEAALWAVLRRLGVGAWRVLRTPPVPALPRQVRVRAAFVLPAHVRPLRHAVVRRGPPLAGF
ncbi:MFS transporter [Herbidospora sp. NEAU-GS84]|uniref:MFS transporter n=1 Tax=Herbidospora solisilvae TaxID=2696284 RepID=A0A7C9NBX9_9ACTN|nr:MFS transporter [Herbidospora solisilvae]NAS20675.1 MFS transporter [Herbidospora solisilvae]